MNRLNALLLLSAMVFIGLSIMMAYRIATIKPVVVREIVMDTVYVPDGYDRTMSLSRFKLIISKIESGSNHKAVSGKYLGKYQISAHNVRKYGYGGKLFISDFRIQENVMDRLIKDYLFEMTDYIQKYQGTFYEGVKLDVYSIMSGCHSIGTTKMKRWLNNPCKNRLYHSLLKFQEVRDGM